MRHILLEVELEALEKRLTFAEPSLEDRVKWSLHEL
ncbi:hypothetical protein FVEN_g12631 [Fusarium venenatum]|nr:hypothetical protein FVEN_g12631 [Fusarium venenatum]